MLSHKLRQKLTLLIHRHNEHCNNYAICFCGDIADAIFQSPDLRVTLVEKKDFVSEMIKRTRYELCSTAEYRILDILDELNARFNSKEPK